MTIKQLKYIAALSERKNFSKASLDCNISQPTLSMQIQKLEEELGITIFNRSKKPIELTQKGEQIIIQAKKTIREFERISEIINTKKEILKGGFIFKNYNS